MAADTIQVGMKAPDFKLPGVDGKMYSLEGFKDKKGVVVIFSCNHCPYVRAYEDRIKAIQKDYADKGIQLVAINANDSDQHEDDSFEFMKVRSKEKDFNFPYLRDEDQSTAGAYGASHTPEIFLLDHDKKVIYSGKIDDNWKEEDKVQTRYLRNALDELLRGEEISVPETFSMGCTIKWKNNY